MDDDAILARALEIIQGRRTAGPTVAEIYQPYARAKAKVKSWKIVEGKLRPVIARFGSRPAMSITIADTEDYRDERRHYEFPRGKGKMLSDLSINFELQWLKCMLTWAARGGRIAHNPLAHMKDAKVKKTRKTSPTEDDIAALLAQADTTMRAFILLASDSGMRRNEIRLCRWSWINEATRMLTIPAPFTKSQKERVVPVTGRTFDALRLQPRHLRSDAVFANPNSRDGTPIAAEMVNDRFRAICDASGIQGAPGDGPVRIQDLRHSFARRAARAGVRIEVISMILGHATIQQTMVYLQTGDDDVSDALDTFEAAIRKPPKRADHIPGVGSSTTAKNNNP